MWFTNHKLLKFLNFLYSFSDALTNWAIRSRVQLALRAIFLQLLQFHIIVQCSHFISAIAFFSHRICFKRNLAQVITLVTEWINTYGIHHWRIFRSSYKKLAWMGFEPMSTEFRSDALTDWAIRLWVQFALGIHVSFRPLLLSVATSVLSKISLR